jgi:hypothetical protein
LNDEEEGEEEEEEEEGGRVRMPWYASLIGSWMGSRRGQGSDDSLRAHDAAERIDVTSSLPCVVKRGEGGERGEEYD